MKYQLSFLLIFSLFLYSCGDKEVMQVEEAIRPVRFAKISKANAASTNTFSGVSQSSKEANLSFKVAGTINKINVKVGDKVRRGQVIASLDNIDYSIEYDQAMANLKNAETQIKAAQTQKVTTKSAYQRIEKLYENNSVPLSDYEQAKASYEAAESQYDAAIAQVNAAKKQTQAAKNQVSYARLTAPFGGVITAVLAEENELLGSGKPVAVLSAETKPEVSVGVPELFISNVKKSQKVNIHFSVLADKNYTGTVSEVAYSASDASTYPVIVQIDKPGNEIRPGMAATVSFASGNTQPKSATLFAPAKAIGSGNNGNFAFILKKEGNNYTAKKTNVEIGQLLNEGFEIKKGLSEGELVATAGLSSLLDGMKVKLME